jgi:Brp/Blh family beta-carotene 15,15'-monooxygenase
MKAARQNLYPRPLPSNGTGAYPAYVPVPKFFWPAFVSLTLALALDVPLTGNGFLALAAVLMLIGGLPHGAFDIAIAQSVLKLKRSSAAAFFLAYVGVAVAMMALWALAPVTTLCLFLALSAVHFGEDWRMLDSGLLRAMAGASVLCIPAFAHPDSVTALFVAMAGPEADWVRRFIVAFTPVAVLVTSVGMLMAVRAGHSGWALAQFAALLALAVLPPQVGFLLYFVFLHSPLHMRGVAATLPSWSGPRFWIYGGLMCFACLALAVLLAPGLISGQSLAMSAEAFRLLSVVAAPHLLLTLFVDRWVRT